MKSLGTSEGRKCASKKLEAGSNEHKVTESLIVCLSFGGENKCQDGVGDVSSGATRSEPTFKANWLSSSPGLVFSHSYSPSGEQWCKETSGS
jgi:hypothetical protein